MLWLILNTWTQKLSDYVTRTRFGDAQSFALLVPHPSFKDVVLRISSRLQRRKTWGRRTRRSASRLPTTKRRVGFEWNGKLVCSALSSLKSQSAKKGEMTKGVREKKYNLCFFTLQSPPLFSLAVKSLYLALQGMEYGMRGRQRLRPLFAAALLYLSRRRHEMESGGVGVASRS